MFRFKQFTIQQDRTAMKVCTDACVLGAYADVQGDRILDIGTGTGLLALMAAQRNPTAHIDAVELDEAAAKQATENIAASPFVERVQLIQGQIQSYLTLPKRWIAPGSLVNTESAPPLPLKERGSGGEVEAEGYDRILTNPPFYTNHLASPDAALNRALHTGDLPFTELIDAVVRLLKKDGQWWVLLPPYEASQLAQLADSAGLRPFQRLQLRHNADKPAFRVITGFGYGADVIREDTLTVYETQPAPAGKLVFTNRFTELLKPFYLIF